MLREQMMTERTLHYNSSNILVIILKYYVNIDLCELSMVYASTESKHGIIHIITIADERPSWSVISFGPSMHIH